MIPLLYPSTWFNRTDPGPKEVSKNEHCRSNVTAAFGAINTAKLARQLLCNVAASEPVGCLNASIYTHLLPLCLASFVRLYND